MERWEYLTKFIKADVKNKGVTEFFKSYNPDWKNPPPYSPETMMPELDDLGNQGWEVIHMEPVAKVGSKGDVLVNGDSSYWSNTYFCVLKRRKPAI